MPEIWNVNSLKQHFDDLRKADKDALAIALTSADKATTKAEEAQKVVNASQNEFRGTLKDQAATLMPRSESEQVAKELRSQIDDLKGKVTSIESSKQGAANSLKGVYAAIAALAGLVLLANTVL
jgi:hypothetical protein